MAAHGLVVGLKKKVRRFKESPVPLLTGDI
jgi:hypothetical protein